MAKPSDLGKEIEALAEEHVTETSGPQSKQKDRAKARRIEAMSLRLAGLTYEQVGERLQITTNSARELIHRNLQRADNRAVEDMRSIENARLDRVQAAIWSDAISGDTKAIDTYLRISARRARLNGMDAPTQINLSTHVKVEMETALNELQNLVLGDVVEADVIEDDNDE